MIFPAIVLPIILRNEGVRFSPNDPTKIIDTGYVNDPSDPGGETNFGITQKTYDSTLVKKIKDITIGEVSHIYERDYWQASKCDEIAEIYLPLAINLCDCAVNCGVGTAIITLQSLLGVHSDGIIGSETLNAIKASNLAELNSKYSLARTLYYAHLAVNNPKTLKFLSGWIIRVSNVFKAGVNSIALASTTTS